jgi:acyl-CoA reductase-like NAD-dependent aldehyde dehydrogenase
MLNLKQEEIFGPVLLLMKVRQKLFLILSVRLRSIFFPADCVLNYSQLQAESLDDAIQIVNRNK